MSSSTATATACFNPNCKESSEKRWRGWRRRTGEYVQLCDRCSAAYEEGKFCETFHLSASGWRCCESCGKQIHCGCIVSFHMFVLLDAGGIECLTCAKKSYTLTPNPAWPPPSHILPSKPERMKDLSIKSWSALAGSGPVPWRQAPSAFSSLNFQSDTQPGMPSGINVSGLNQKGHFYRSINDFQPILTRSDSSSNFNLATASSCKTDTDDTHATIISIQSDKHICCQNGVVSGEIQVLNGKALQDGRGRNKLLTQHCSLTTHEHLQHIASDSNTGITPLFEKKLTASDVGRVGRLVLPKKCAEAYFPPLAHPEGEALKVQEVKGKEWVFHFRYWPNNNSRMYVLDGITPCIQSMQLQAGDVVTFSRLEPEGKLVIGGRKASIIPSSNQGNEGTVVASGTSIPRDDSTRNKSGDVYVNCTAKDKPTNSIFPINQAAKADMGISQSDIDKSGYIAKNVRESKKNNCNLGMKSKRLKIENQDSLELNLNWNEAQGLMRQPGGTVPSVFVVEGWEFEEFEEAPPVIGRPTIIWTDNFGKKIRLVQCEDCFKWRKVPADAHLTSRWICSGNVWDLDRSSCLAAQELAKEQLDDILRALSKVSPKEETTEQDPDPCVALEGLDTLTNSAIQDEGGGSEHPRHKPGCACIVCLQPPSGKGLNHKQPCDCVVCNVLKHRFRTLMEMREKRQPEINESKSTKSAMKGEIDLNIQPEREEELVLHHLESVP